MDNATWVVLPMHLVQILGVDAFEITARKVYKIVGSRRVSSRFYSAKDRIAEKSPFDLLKFVNGG